MRITRARTGGTGGNKYTECNADPVSGLKVNFVCATPSANAIEVLALDNDGKADADAKGKLSCGGKLVARCQFLVSCSAANTYDDGETGSRVEGDCEGGTVEKLDSPMAWACASLGVTVCQSAECDTTDVLDEARAKAEEALDDVCERLCTVEGGSSFDSAFLLPTLEALFEDGTLRSLALGYVDPAGPAIGAVCGDGHCELAQVVCDMEVRSGCVVGKASSPMDEVRTSCPVELSPDGTFVELGCEEYTWQGVLDQVHGQGDASLTPVPIPLPVDLGDDACTGDVVDPDILQATIDGVLILGLPGGEDLLGYQAACASPPSSGVTVLTVYEHINYGGASWPVRAPSGCTPSQGWGWGYVGKDWNDRISSVKVQAGTGCGTVVLYEHRDFAGRQASCPSACSDLRTQSFNDLASSIIVV